MKLTMLIVALMLNAGPGLTAQEPSISFGPIQPAKDVDRPAKPREFTVTVQLADEEEPQRFKVRGPYKLLALDEEPHGKIFEDRLVVTTSRVLAVFDLKTGEEVFYSVAAPRIVVSESGRRVAFETLQLKFRAPEATSSIIQVLDLSTFQVGPVFPERSIIESPNGRLLVWVDELADRHTAGDLYFSPDGSRLVFFCGHGGSTMPDVQRALYLVVVDLSRGLEESRFIHRPFDWVPYMRRDADVRGRRTYFAVESLTWRDGHTLVAKPTRSAKWLKDEMVIELLDPDWWSAKTESSEDTDHAP